MFPFKTKHPVNKWKSPEAPQIRGVLYKYYTFFLIFAKIKKI